VAKDTGIGSYSYANRADLPGGEPSFYATAPKSREAFDNARDPLIAEQKRDLGKSEAQRRFEQSRRADSGLDLGSDMIRRDQPKPVLKPSPALSMGPDRAAFNRAWSDEHRAARKKDKDKEPLPEASSYTPPLQQVRVTFAFREIETRETFIESRRLSAKTARKRETQSR
jgi:hypothetical protein